MNRIILATCLSIAVATDAKSQNTHFFCNQMSAQNVVSCVHPTATYTACQPTGPLNAKIFFKGGFTGHPYEMDVVGEINGNFSRTLVLRDTAPPALAPITKCNIDQWTPMIRFQQ